MNDEPRQAPRAETAPADAPAVWWRGRGVVRLVLFAALVYLLVVLLMMALESALIFFPSIYPDGYWNPPGLKFEDAWFETPDGTKLHGWYVPHDTPRAAILFAHGNAGNLSHRYELLRSLHELGVSVMIFDYRGYGKSQGAPTEAGILADARAARRWLAHREGTDEGQIVLMGESLGGGVMVDLAARDGARALVLENTFTSLPDVASYHYPWLPVKLLMRTRMNSLAKIGDYRGPLLQVHGEADTIIPIELGRRLFAAAGQPKQFVAIADGDHNDPRTPEFFQALDQFIDELPSGAGPVEPSPPR